MFSSNYNSGFPVLVIYYTKNRILYKEKTHSKNTFNSIIENFQRNPSYKNDAKFKNKYYLYGREIRKNQLLEEIISKSSHHSYLKQAELSIELEELFYTGDSSYQSFTKIIQPKLNPFGLYVYTPKEGTIYLHSYPEKTISLFELKNINDGSAYCNSYNDLYISGCNGVNNKDFWIINNNNYEIKKKNMPTNKKNHSMIFLNFNENDQWIFIVGGNDKKSFYYDLKKNYFINWGDTNEIYIKPALIQIREYLYIFDSVIFSKRFIERTKIINPNRKWEKVNINIDKQIYNYFPTKFGLSYDSNGKILLLGGDNINNMNNTLIFEPGNNTITLSKNGTNDDTVFDDKTFYKISKRYNISLPHHLSETKEICVADKEDQSLIKINIECPNESNKIHVYSNISFDDRKQYINNDKGNLTVKSSNIEINDNDNDFIQQKINDNKQKLHFYDQTNYPPPGNMLLCDDCINKNNFICPCCHKPFQRNFNNFNNYYNNMNMNGNENLRSYNKNYKKNENVINPTRENPKVTIIDDEYTPLGQSNYNNKKIIYKKIYNKNYNRALDKSKVEVVYDEYIPMKIDYKINKKNPINKYSYKKGIEQQEKNMQENNNKKEEIISNIQNEIKEKNDIENDVVEYKNNEQENKDDDLFVKSQNEEENQNEIIIEENHNNEEMEGIQENNMEGDQENEHQNIEEEGDKEDENNGQMDVNEGNNIISQNKEIINGELPKDSLEFKDAAKLNEGLNYSGPQNKLDFNNAEIHSDNQVEDENNEINKVSNQNKDDIVIRNGDEYHSMEEYNEIEPNNSVEHIENGNNVEIYENGNEIKFEGENENNNINEKENEEDNNNIDVEEENKIVQFDGEEGGEINVEDGEEEGEEEINYEQGGEEEMNYEGEEIMNYEGGNEEGNGSLVENNNENGEQNSVIENKHDEDENGNGEEFQEGGNEGVEMNYKQEDEEHN